MLLFRLNLNNNQHKPYFITIVYSISLHLSHDFKKLRNLTLLIVLKNNDKEKWKEHLLRDGLILIHYDEKSNNRMDIEVNEKVVQYFFCVKGSMNFSFHGGSYNMPLKEGENCFFYNPNEILKPTITAEQESQLLFLFCSLEKIHQLFLDSSNELEFLNSENVNQKIYKKDHISTNLTMVLKQILESNDKSKTGDIFRYAKSLEILSLYFAKQAKDDNTSCPYIQDEDSVQKIKHAKDILIARMKDPPVTSKLATEVGLNEHRLKEGFKSLYGSTLFQYLLDYKMNQGKSMLDTGNYKIKEVAYELGYTNPSHFISAFKSKFEVTPKKYILSK